MTNDERQLKQVDYHLMMARGSAISLQDLTIKEAILFKIDIAQEFLQKIINYESQ